MALAFLTPMPLSVVNRVASAVLISTGPVFCVLTAACLCSLFLITSEAGLACAEKTRLVINTAELIELFFS